MTKIDVMILMMTMTTTTIVVSYLDAELFGDFFSAMFTMFQVMTGDAWSDVARALMDSTGNPAMVRACVWRECIN